MVTRPDEEQRERNQIGVAACRAVLTAAKARRAAKDEEDQPLTRSDEILLAARAEAARQREVFARLRRQAQPKEKP